MNRKRHTSKTPPRGVGGLFLISILALSQLFVSCEGVFDFVYDKPETQTSVSGQIYIDASSWSKWYYVDLQAIVDSIAKDSTYDASKSVVCMDIPMKATGDTTHVHGLQLAGQYMYWYDIFGEGLSNNRFEYFTPTDPQPEPSSWTFAIHRDNVRTNGGAAWESQLTDISQVTSTLYSTAEFTEDTFSENEVWDDNSQMLLKYVPSQGITLNKVLGSWLTMYITTPPPTFVHNNHVFILRTKNGQYAALQLADYISTKGVKCCMTIKYKYPL